MPPEEYSVATSDYASVFSDGNQREKTMNEKTVGGEADSIIRLLTDHFTQQMLDLLAVSEVIRDIKHEVIAM